MKRRIIKSYFSPVIIIGMHRSGTSLVSKVLQELGVFMGWDQQKNNEATFFSYRNEAIMNFLGGSWANPVQIELFKNNSKRDRILRRIRKDISSFSVISYLGPTLFIQYNNLLKLDFLWGWKDPRNIFTLSLWLDIFPNSKIIHIYRNGVDVSQSLINREKKRMDLLKSEGDGIRYFFSRQIRLFRDKGLMVLLFRRYWELLKYFEYIYMNSHKTIEGVITLEHSFKLWCSYLDQIDNIETKRKNTIMHIKYEDFLSNPGDNIMKFAKFCNITIDKETVFQISHIINPNRKFSFLKNDSLIDFYKKVENNYWMVKLGYSKLLT